MFAFAISIMVSFILWMDNPNKVIHKDPETESNLSGDTLVSKKKKPTPRPQPRPLGPMDWMHDAASFGGAVRPSKDEKCTILLGCALAPDISLGSVWPPVGIESLSPWSLPLLGTTLLLCSGLTITLSHHALLVGDKATA